MNNIFFEQKGCTKKANVDNLWPTKYFTYTPQAFFESLGDLFVLINPIQIDKCYFTFTIIVYSALNVKYINYGNNVCASTYPLLNATYSCKRLSLNFYPVTKERGYTVEQQEHWYDLHNMIEIVREAVAKCDKYFPKQTP